MSKRFLIIVAPSSVLNAQSSAQRAADSNEKLASDFWAWRARTGQYTGDDVTRIERPFGVMRDWSPTGIENQRKELATFEERWKAVDDPKAPVHQPVDHQLMGSALARVHWQLDILKRWRRDPSFYIEQTLTPVGEALTVPGPYDEKQSREILARLNRIPSILEQAKENLSSPPASYAQMAIDSLADIGRVSNRPHISLETSIDPLLYFQNRLDWFLDAGRLRGTFARSTYEGSVSSVIVLWDHRRVITAYSLN
jgi:hypothetical protein